MSIPISGYQKKYNNPILGKVKMIYSGKMRIDFTRSDTKMFGMWFMELSFVPSRRLLQIQFKLVSLNLMMTKSILGGVNFLVY